MSPCAWLYIHMKNSCFVSEEPCTVFREFHHHKDVYIFLMFHSLCCGFFILCQMKAYSLGFRNLSFENRFPVRVVGGGEKLSMKPTRNFIVGKKFLNMTPSYWTTASFNVLKAKTINKLSGKITVAYHWSVYLFRAENYGTDWAFSPTAELLCSSLMSFITLRSFHNVRNNKAWGTFKK